MKKLEALVGIPNIAPISDAEMPCQFYLEAFFPTFSLTITTNSFMG